jgi:hypothetical protein
LNQDIIYDLHFYYVLKTKWFNIFRFLSNVVWTHHCLNIWDFLSLKHEVVICNEKVIIFVICLDVTNFNVEIFSWCLSTKMVGTSQHETNLVYQINNKKSYIDVFAHLDILRLSAWEVGVLSLRGQAVGGSLPMMSK